MQNKEFGRQTTMQIILEGDGLIYRVTIDGDRPQTMVASEDKLKEWLGFRKFEKLKKQGKIEQVTNPGEDMSYDTAAI